MTTKKMLQLAIFLVSSHSFSQLGIGTSLPNPSAQLDVVSSDKGILIPRISLTSLTDASTITNGNLESLMVYNTSNTGGLTPGYYYWANATWHRLALQEEISALPRDVTSTNGSIMGTAADAALVAMDLEVKVDGSTIEVDALNGVQIKDAGITNAKVADNTITAAKIGTAGANDANTILGTDGMGNPEWQDAATLATSLGEDVTSTNGSITGTADDAALVAMDLEVKVDGSTIEVDGTNGVQVKDDGITTVKILDDNVTVSKLGAVTGDANKLLGSDATGNVEWQDAATIATSLGEDVTSTNGSITGTADDATLVAMDLEVKVDDTTIEVDGTNGVQVKDDGIDTAKIADNAVDGTKIQVTGEAEGSMLYNNGTDWVDFPKGTAKQVLTMNAAGTAPEWMALPAPPAPAPTKRVGEFVFAKYGRALADGYLAVKQGTVTNGAVNYPLWAAQYPEFVSGRNIVFPADVSGMFLRNRGGYATTEGRFQDEGTARPHSNFTTNTTGDHQHYIYGDTASEIKGGGSGDHVLQNGDGYNTGEYTSESGNHNHSVTGGGDSETRPKNRAYQLYTIVDTY